MARDPAVDIEILLLGPLEIRRSGRPLELGGGRQRALLAILALHAGETVSNDRLVEELWRERPPPTAVNALRNLVSQIRKTIDPDQTGLVATRAPGYALDIPPAAIDVYRFKSLASEGHTAVHDDPARASSLLRQALGLWRGDALAEFAYDHFAQSEIVRLDEIRAAALHDRIDADLSLGLHTELVSELRTLVENHALDEHHHRQHMLALYRCGRQAEALEGYRALRTRLHDELGLEPTVETRRLEQSILAQDPSLGSMAKWPAPSLRGRRRRGVFLFGAAVLAALAATAVALLIGGKGSAAPEVFPDALAKIDTRTNQIVDVVSVGRHPGPLAIVGRYVFVSSAKDNTLSRVDRKSGEVITQGGFSRPRGMRPDGPSLLWVVNEGRHEVVHMDVATMEPLDRISVPSAGLGYVAIGDGSLWLAESPPAAVSRWALDTLHLQRRYHLRSAPYPLEIGFADGAAWVALADSGEILRVDAQDGTTSRIGVGSGPGGPPTPGFGSIWVSTTDGHLWRIDTATRKPVAIIRLGANPFGIAVGAGSVWVANHEAGTVSRVDPRSDSVVATIRTGFFPQWLVADENYVWVGISSTHWGFAD